MDYLELLKKYMQHVADEEGSTYVFSLNYGYSDVRFTDEEVQELQNIAENLE